MARKCEGLLKETEQRTHVVTCDGDWAGPFEEIIPVAPPVDVLPAVREGSHLLIPERGTGWIENRTGGTHPPGRAAPARVEVLHEVIRHGEGMGQA